MPRKMSKDGETFFDVDDSEESTEAAKSKGYKEYIPMTKNGVDVFNVEFSEDSYTKAVSKGYKDLDRFNFETTKTPQDVSLGESVMKGLGNATSLGDEATGLAGAIINPTDSDKGFGDRYRDSRDFAREGDKAAIDQHPVGYIGGRIAGGVAGAVLAPVTNTLGGSVALGGGMGLGDSEADLTDPSLANIGQAALDTGIGATTGLAGYGVGKGIEKLPAAVSSIANNAETYLRAIGRGTVQGAKEMAKDAPQVAGISHVAATIGGLKGAIKEVKAVAGDLKEFSEIAQMARKIRPISELSEGSIQFIGAGKELADFSDEEAILMALTSEGDNPVKQWFAQKAAMLQPGQVDADEYAKILKMSGDSRNVARDFDPRDAAASLKPVVEDTQDLFINARNDRFKQLQDKARAAFDPRSATPVFRSLDEAIEDASNIKSIPGSVRAVLDDAEQMIYYGTGTKQMKLTPGNWDKVGSTEQFNRLQKARELIDSQVQWAKDKNMSMAEQVLAGFRGDIDNVLKISPDKIEADGIFSASKRVEKNFFDATDFRGSGIDESKIKGLLGDTDRANRFRSSMEEFRMFVNDPDLAPAFRDQGQKLIDQIESATGTMAQKGDLGAFRYKQGPTSPAVERMQSIQGKNSLTQDAVRSPSGFVNTADQFSKFMQKRLGKTLDQMEGPDKQAAIRFWVWSKKHPEASAAQFDGMFKQLFPNAENKAAIEQFLKN